MQITLTQHIKNEKAHEIMRKYYFPTQKKAKDISTCKNSSTIKDYGYSCNINLIHFYLETQHCMLSLWSLDARRRSQWDYFENTIKLYPFA